MTGTQRSIQDFPIRIFVAVSLVWALVGLAICAALTQEFRSAALWMLGLWALCLADLFTLARALQGALTLAAGGGDPKTRSACVFRTLFWGGAKLVCLGSFVAALRYVKTAPTAGVLPGLATLMIVPLAGGFWWSQRELKHAS